MTRLRNLPHVGRYRLFDRARSRYRCRACGRSFREDNLERHKETEIRRLGEAGVIRRIQIRLVKRGKDRYRRRTQYYHEKAMALEGIELDSRFDKWGERLSSDAPQVPLTPRDAESSNRRTAAGRGD